MLISRYCSLFGYIWIGRSIQKISFLYVVEHLLIWRKPFLRGRIVCVSACCWNLLEMWTYYLSYFRREESSIGFTASIRANMRVAGLTNAVVTSSLLESVRFEQTYFLYYILICKCIIVLLFASKFLARFFEYTT